MQSDAPLCGLEEAATFEFKLTRRIEFAETDMAGIVHFANFFRMMEATEHAFFRSLGFFHPRSGSGRHDRLAASQCLLRLHAAAAL